VPEPEISGLRAQPIKEILELILVVPANGTDLEGMSVSQDDPYSFSHFQRLNSHFITSWDLLPEGPVRKSAVLILRMRILQQQIAFALGASLRDPCTAITVGGSYSYANQ